MESFGMSTARLEAVGGWVVVVRLMWDEPSGPERRRYLPPPSRPLLGATDDACAAFRAYATGGALAAMMTLCEMDWCEGKDRSAP